MRGATPADCIDCLLLVILTSDREYHNRETAEVNTSPRFFRIFRNPDSPDAAASAGLEPGAMSMNYKRSLQLDFV
jgi:hypothetical protein